MNTRWMMNAGAFSWSLLVCGSAVAQSAALAASEAIVDLHSSSGAPAVSAAVWADGEIAWAEAQGFASLELGVRATPEHRFRLASVSKVLTSAVVGRLVDQASFDLDADVRTYVDSFPEKPGTITTRLLLGHLGGVRHYTNADMDPTQPGGIIDLRIYPDTASALAIFQNDGLIAAPGDRYSYSTFAFTLIGASIESATGKPFSQALSEQVSEPLGLSSLVLEDVRAILPNQVAFYDIPQPMLGESPDEGIRRAFPANPAYKWPGGGMLATPSDVARFGAAHLEPGFLSEDLLSQMMTPQSTNAGQSTGVGLAWRVGEDSEGRRIWHHAGNQAGSRAVVIVWPDHGVSVAVCTNLSGTPPDILVHGEAIADGFLR